MKKVDVSRQHDSGARAWLERMGIRMGFLDLDNERFRILNLTVLL